MRRDLFVRIGLGRVLAGLFPVLSTNAFAVAILTAPTFTQATNAPLAGTLTLTTDVPSRVSVSVNDGTNIWEKDFYDFGTKHSEPLLGFKPARTNQITVTVYDTHRNTATASQPLAFVTGPTPPDFPTSAVLVDNPAQMEPGYTLMIVVNQNDNYPYIIITDNSGQVVWYSASSPSADDVRQLTNGDLFMPNSTETSASNFIEMNLLGETVETYPVPASLPINVHDGVPTSHGTILYLTDASQFLTNFPTGPIDPDAPLQDIFVDYNLAVEISATNGALLHTWSLIDMLDPYRLTYLTFQFSTGLGLDIQHANAIIEDPSDNSIIVSLREQNAVIKFSRAGELKWILGPPQGWPSSFQQFLFTPVGTRFEWSYGQHAPILTPQGTLMMYDDGNFRAMPYDPFVADRSNYSRAVEYSLNETNMEISQVWDSGQTNDDRLFTAIVGNAQWLPQTGHVLATFGDVSYVNGNPPNPNATMVRIKEFTHDPVAQVVFDLAFFDYGDPNSGYPGYFCYRSHRIPDLYGHPLAPVANLTVSYDDGIPLLGFSADPTLAYAVQSSMDLVNWQTLGTAQAVDQAGDFQFSDPAPNRAACFYRVLTGP